MVALGILALDARAQTPKPPAAGWPQWRGQNRDGVSPEGIAIWPPAKLWETNVGYGVSSAIASGGRVYAIGHREGADTVFCFDGETGRVVWKYSYPCKSDQTSDVHFPGPRSTPATDGRAVYAVSLEGRVNYLEAATGKLLWTKSPAETGASDKQQYGVCCPPLLWERMVICDVATRCVALDRATGELIWQTAGGGGWNGAAPMIVQLGEKTCVLHGTGRCLEAATGRELWSVPFNEMSVLTPIVSGNRFFLAPFHGRNLGGKECVVMQSTGGKPTVVWKNDEVQALCLSGVLHRGFLYVPDRDDVSIGGESGRKMNLKCIDFKTGEVKWTWRPLPWPTVIVAGERLLMQTLEGELILAEVSPAGYKELGRAPGVGGRCWTVPALADGKLYCRNNKGELAAFRVGGPWPQITGPAERQGDSPILAAPKSGQSPAQSPVREGDSPIFAARKLGQSPTGCASAEAAEYWPRFRGPGGTGVAMGGAAPIAWDGKTGAGVLWKTPVPLAGYSSPVVWADRVFLTGGNAKAREVYCFDADSGKMLWQKAVANSRQKAEGPAKPWDAASYAAPTPAINGRHVWATFANGDLVCLDRDGKQVWAQNLGTPENQYGHAASLVLLRDLLLVQLDEALPQHKKSRLLALHAQTGKTVWEAKRAVGAGWTTPIVIAAVGREQIITCGNPLVVSYDTATGAELWRTDSLEGGYYAVPSPIFARGLVYSVTEGAMLAAIRPDGRGDVSKTHVVWRAEDDLPNVCTPLSNGELLFLLTSQGMLTCHEAQSGKRLWQKDLAVNREFQASPCLAGGHLYVLDTQGRMSILPASREQPGELQQAELGEPCPGATPAFSGGRIYIRGRKHLYSIGAPSAAAPRGRGG